MTRAYALKPDEVIERRLSLADARSPKPTDSETWSKLATLPPGETSAEEQLWGRRAVARHAMVGGHGCTGRRCRKAGHQADLDVRDQLLEVLGLGGEVR